MKWNISQWCRHFEKMAVGVLRNRFESGSTAFAGPLREQPGRAQCGPGRCRSHAVDFLGAVTGRTAVRLPADFLPDYGHLPVLRQRGRHHRRRRTRTHAAGVRSKQSRLSQIQLEWVCLNNLRSTMLLWTNDFKYNYNRKFEGCGTRDFKRLWKRWITGKIENETLTSLVTIWSIWNDLWIMNSSVNTHVKAEILYY